MVSEVQTEVVFLALSSGSFVLPRNVCSTICTGRFISSWECFLPSCNSRVRGRKKKEKEPLRASFPRKFSLSRKYFHWRWVLTVVHNVHAWRQCSHTTTQMGFDHRGGSSERENKGRTRKTLRNPTSGAENACVRARNLVVLCINVDN